MTTTAQAPRNTIFNGDCIDMMQAFDTGSIDLILTDPPYVIRYRDRQGRSVSNPTEPIRAEKRDRNTPSNAFDFSARAVSSSPSLGSTPARRH